MRTKHIEVFLLDGFHSQVQIKSPKKAEEPVAVELVRPWAVYNGFVIYKLPGTAEVVLVRLAYDEVEFIDGNLNQAIVRTFRLPALPEDGFFILGKDGVHVWHSEIPEPEPEPEVVPESKAEEKAETVEDLSQLI